MGLATLRAVSKRGRPRGAARLIEAAGLAIGALEMMGFAMRSRADFSYARHAFWLAPVLTFLRAIRVPIVLEVNGLVTTERRQASDGDRSLTLVSRFEVMIVRLASRIRCVSGVLARELADAGVPPDRIFVEHNGVDRHVFDVRHAESEGPCLVGFVGSGHKWHDLPTLLDAFEQTVRVMPDARLLIVGPEREKLEKSISEKGLTSHVELRGPVSHEEAVAAYEEVEIAVNPGSAPHHSPLKLFEAMALGKPIIAGRAEGICEVLEHDRTALLFEQGNAGELADAILRLLGDEGERKRIGNAARNEAREKHTWQNVADAVIRAGVGH